MRLVYLSCGKPVSTELPENTIVRAVVTCPECYEKENANDEEKGIKDNEFQCGMCKGVFEKGRSDEEAFEEELNNFGKIDPEASVICDDCYKELVSGGYIAEGEGK